MGAERPTGVPEGEEPSSKADEGAADVVDFDALHAALGELPPPPTSSRPMLSESQGRMNATYASVRPHKIPSTRPPSVGLNVPRVIVAPEDLIPPVPPQKKTMPLAGAPPLPKRQLVTEPLPLPPARDPMNRPQTVILRVRGPSNAQKLLVFVAMLLVFVGGGIAFLIYGRHLGVELPR
jgi:hypothetical protein